MKIKEIINKYKNEVDIADIDFIFYEKFKISKAEILANPEIELDTEDADAALKIFDKLLTGYPVQYLLGYTYFMKNKIYVSEGVLIPRNDTEVVCETAINLLKEKKENPNVLDLCAGTGCIGISINQEIKNASLKYADISDRAISLAPKNNIEIIKSDIFSSFDKKKDKFDMIISNPPYIETDVIDSLDKKVKDFEPQLALDGGKDGLYFYKEIINKAPDYLNEKGILIFEIGYNQEKNVRKLFEENGHFTNINSLKDYGGNYRVIYGSISS